MTATVRSYWSDVVSRAEGLEFPIVKWPVGNIRHNNLYYPYYWLVAGNLDKNNMDVLLSGGTHGDENGGVEAILKFAEDDIKDFFGDFNFFMFVCTNPSAYETGQRENAEKINLNRDFSYYSKSQEVQLMKRCLRNGRPKYAFAIDMHEDNSFVPAEGFELKDNPLEFYLYETCLKKERMFGPSIIREVEKYAPVCRWPEIYKEKNEDGVIWNLNNKEGDDKTFEGYLATHYTRNAMTTETPTRWDMDKRVMVHRVALKAALAEAMRRKAAREEMAGSQSRRHGA